jgi:hypothetical protein
LPAQRLEDGVAEEVLDLDLREVPSDEGLVVLPQLSVISDTADLEMSSSPVASLKAFSTSLVDRPRAYISVTKRTSELPSKKLMRFERYVWPAPRTCGTATSMVPSAVRIRPGL